MDEKISELKESQVKIGNKINMIQKTNKQKDEEAGKIRELIAECRENLNRIKRNAAGSFKMTGKSSCDSNRSQNEKNQMLPCGARIEDICARYRDISATDEPCWGITDSLTGDSELDLPQSATTKIATQISALADAKEKSKICLQKIGQKIEKGIKMRVKSQRDDSCGKASSGEKSCDFCDCDSNTDVPYEEQVSCRVNLTNMKVNIRGSPKDLKKLNAVQLINLLDKFQCQELVISTDGEAQQRQTFLEQHKTVVFFQDMREVPVIYLTHPGNMVLLVGIIMVAYLISANLCNSKRSSRVKFFLNMLYLSTFAFHYGVVLWMGIIRGLTLQSGLSREAFIIVDNLILPKYFAICVFLSALTLYSFLAIHCITSCTSWSLSVFFQVLVKCITFFVELVTICYIVPAIIKLRNVLDEVGSDDIFPEGYCTNVDKLAKLNWILSFINALTIIFMGSNMYYITSKLNMG